MSLVIAVDGAAATGKGTVTRYIAEKLNLITIDTGALYRSVTFEILNKGIDIKNIEQIKEILDNIYIDLDIKNGKQFVFLNGEDVSTKIRTPEINKNVSEVSAIKEVREAMVKIQRGLANGKNIIMEGRDIGTTVFPDADIKIFLECSAEERAKRRVKQNKENGIESSYEEVLESIKNRDKIDSTREISPLRKADDAIVVKTDGCDEKTGPELVYQAIKKELENRKMI